MANALKAIGLTDKQARFVEEYLKDMNATQAAIRAGYSEKAARKIAHELLTKPHVASAVRAAQMRRSERVEITQDMVVKELAKVGFSSMSDVASWNESGVTFKASDAVDESALGSVMAVEETTNEHGGSLKIKQYDKVKALELLGKHLGMFVERKEHSVVLDRIRELERLSGPEMASLLKGIVKELEAKDGESDE